MPSRTILVTGALGQIGSELVPALQRHDENAIVIRSDIKSVPANAPMDGPFEHLDCNDLKHLVEVIRRNGVDCIYHMAALLSAVAEERPQLAWQVNMGGLYNVLEAARQCGCSVFFPSSIGAFGPSTPKDGTPQVTIQRPNTMYGVTKVAGELLCDYYAERFGVDTRGLRLPGLISHVTPPGGGTTDYAVEIFYHAIRYHKYTCFLRSDSRLDMMYMPDAIRAMIELMDAAPARLTVRNAYNVTAMSITPADLVAAIREQMPEFAISYDVDPVRQAIADSWPHSIDDRQARQDWSWQPAYDLPAMTEDMLEKLKNRIGPQPGEAITKHKEGS
jgi:nucleoside-diphosphate-sugar epimerase